MSEKGKMSQTMRIDLIPDVPAEPTDDSPSVVVALPTRRHRRVKIDSSQIDATSPYQQLLQSVYDAAVITDLAGNVIEVNVRALEFLLYDESELCSITIFDVISGADDTLLESLLENLETERFALIEAHVIRADGTFFPAEIAVNKMTLEEERLCFFIRDITLRRQQQEMLLTEHNAIQNSASGIAIANLKMHLEYANPAVAQLWGVQDPEALIGVDLGDMMADREATEHMVQTVLGDSGLWMGEMRAIRDNGEPFDVQVSAACNKSSEGQPVGVILSFADISDRKRAEQAERESERTRVMLESLGAACHHLGQPATVVLANLGIIQRKVDESDVMMTELVTSSIDAAETLGDILHKLNAVNEYKTTQYLERAGEDTPENRILDI